jgi:CRP/FNR family transcriptional regulator, cyclic AMP receptor protein
MHWDTVIPALETFLLSRITHPAWGDVAGYLGGILVLLSLFKTTMIPLRAVGAGSNLCFVAYGYLDGVYPMMLLHAALFPLNVVRLCQMVKLVRRVRSAAEGSKTLDWLRPYMHRHPCRARAVIFRKSDIADSMFYTVSGHFRLSETGIELPVGVFVGEFGLLTPDGRRTQTLECTEAGELLEITYDQVKMLYFQNPDFGFYFMQLVTSRLFQNFSALEQRLDAANARTNEPGVGADCDETTVPR